MAGPPAAQRALPSCLCVLGASECRLRECEILTGLLPAFGGPGSGAHAAVEPAATTRLDRRALAGGALSGPGAAGPFVGHQWCVVSSGAPRAAARSALVRAVGWGDEGTPTIGDRECWRSFLIPTYRAESGNFSHKDTKKKPMIQGVGRITARVTSSTYISH